LALNEINLSGYVWELKDRILDFEEISVDSQRLIFAGNSWKMGQILKIILSDMGRRFIWG